MAARINELFQAHLEAKKAYRALLERQAAGETLTAADQGELRKLATRVQTTEREHAEERIRLDAETEELIRNPSGRVHPRPRPDEHGEALANFPRLPAASARAITRLYAGAPDLGEEESTEAFRAVLGAALGGQPLHPAVLASTGTEGVPADGGFLVPGTVSRRIFQRAVEESVLARIGASIEPMASAEHIVNAIDDDDESSDQEGGLAAGWSSEIAEATPQTLKFREVKLVAKKLLILAACSNALSEDALGYVAALELALGRAIGKRLDTAGLSGIGGGQPLGILNSPALITIAKEVGQAADTLNWSNVSKAWSRLAPGSHERSVWLAHTTTLPQLLALNIPVGTAGFEPRMALESDGRGGYQLMGRPLYVTSRAQPLGDVGDVMLVDGSQVIIGLRRQLAIERSEHVYFTSDRLAIRAKWRGDIRPAWEKTRTLADGTTTVSPFVVIEAR